MSGDDTTDDAELEQALGLLASANTQYAPFFGRLSTGSQAEDKAASERSIASEAVPRIAASFQETLSGIDAPEKDPPDLFLLTESGLRIGLEVTELVDGEVRAAVQKGALEPGAFRVWSGEQLRCALKAIFERKSLGLDKSCRYNALLVHCDEPWIWADRIKMMGDLGSGVGRFDDVFILFSYDPDEGQYPLFSIKRREWLRS